METGIAMDEKLLKYALENPHSFTMEMNKVELDRENRIIPMTFFKPYLVKKWWGNLKLLAAKKNVDLKRWKQKQGVPFLQNHFIDDQRGIILNGYLKEEVLGGDVKFSRNPPGEELMIDIEDGIRPYSSVGFDILKIRELPEDEMNDEEKSMAISTKMPVYEVYLWLPEEGSSVYSGAIPTVGAFSYDYYDLKKKEEIIEFANEFNLPIKFDQQIKLNSKTNIKENEMTKEELAAQKEEEKKEKLEREKQVEIKIQQDKEAAEKLRKDTITKLADDYKDKVKGIKLNELKEDYINTGQPFQKFGELITDNIVKQATGKRGIGDVSLNGDEAQSYSVFKAFDSVITGAKCFERDISEQCAKQMEVSPKGIIVPYSAMMAAYARVLPHKFRKALKEQFDLTVGGSGTGAELVGTDHLASEFIGILYNRALAFQLGVRQLPNLVGDISIPKMTAGSTFGWAATETGDFSESTPTTAELNLSPKRGGTWVDISTKQIRQSNPAVEGLVVDDLFMAMNLGIDLAFWHGTGSSGQPTGLFLTSGIGDFPGASMDLNAALAAQSDVEVANADVNTMSYVTDPTSRNLLRGRSIESGDAKRLVENNQLAGYPIQVSNQITAGYMAFGDYSQGVVGFWGAAELVKDTSSLAQRKQGLISILIEQFIDVGIRRTGAFSMADDVD